MNRWKNGLVSMVVITAFLANTHLNAQSNLRNPNPRPRNAHQSQRTSLPRKANPNKSINLPLEQKIEQALESQAEFSFNETPLQEFARELSEMYEIPVYIDEAAIEDAGYDKEVPMTGDGKGRTLRSSLYLMFHPYDFCFLIHRETLWITTLERINSNPESYNVIKRYDVTELIEDDADFLVNLIQNSIDPQSWMKTNGGPGTIDSIYIRGRVFLVVGHHSERQHDIEVFLDRLKNDIHADDEQPQNAELNRNTDLQAKRTPGGSASRNGKRPRPTTRKGNNDDPFGGDSNDDDPFGGDSNDDDPFGGPFRN